MSFATFGQNFTIVRSAHQTSAPILAEHEFVSHCLSGRSGIIFQRAVAIARSSGNLCQSPTLIGR
ncbi:hypothetical protein [Microcoleus sp.]|uniref:hypothetical protein n=1 Tax=Microcoleus sp. TaxID=44472 RepID=UPI0035930880